ncbi:MAG: pirin family protein, partial [Gammaproteobacteria bacterium]|nr:pirin family protein [Gammaproteobacteria bacterium]
MPEQENGLLEGFQLWVNLPAEHKMDEPAYQEYSADHIPLESREGGIEVRVITGKTSQGTIGPVVQPLTDPLYLDVRVPAGGQFDEQIPSSHNTFVYVIKGPVVSMNEDGEELQLNRDDLGILSGGNSISLKATEDDTHFLLISGKPLNEPVARGGPFVMNTQAEIQQAFDDYRHGRF